MPIRHRLLLPLLLITAAVTGCDSGTVWKSGSYEVYWVDIPSDLTLGLDLGNGSAIGRVMPQVTAVGEDAQWIVAARHPDGDKTKTEYFYFSKTEDHPHKNAEDIVKGPFTEEAFKKESATLKLPAFTKRF